MASIPDKIHNALIRDSINLARYEAGLRARVLSLLEILGTDLVKELAAAELDTPRTDWQRARLRELLKTAEQRASEVYGEVDKLTREELGGLVQVSADRVVMGVNKAIGADLLQKLNWTEEQLAALADDTLIFGAKSGEWWKRQAVDFSQGFADQMRMGQLRGEALGDLVKRVRGLKDISRKNAETLVRSSAISVANEAHLAAYRANADVVDGIEWISSLDHRSCLVCGSLDSKVWDLEGRPIRGNTKAFPGPVAHWNCFPAGVLVQAPAVLRGFERPYSGDVVIIRTAAGHEITCTPNHPILTAHGWFPAGQVKEGQEVVQCLSGDGIFGATPNAVEVETRIEDVVTTLLGSRGMVPVTVPLTTEDFHGDALDHEVATVWANGELGSKSETVGTEHVCEECLKSAGSSGHAGLSRLGGKAHPFNGWLAPLHGPVDSVSMGLALIFGHDLPSPEHGIAPVPGGDPIVLEPPDHDCPGDTQALRYRFDALAALMGAEDLCNGHGSPVVGQDGSSEHGEVPFESVGLLAAFIRETVEAFPGLVALDEVVDVRRDPGFVGHVYNLETEGNWYVAANIITHNCRCTQVPATKTWEELTGIKGLDDIPPGQRASMGGPVSGDTTYQGWFNGLDEADQRDILGPGRYEAVKKRGLLLADLVDQRGNELTLDELRNR